MSALVGVAQLAGASSVHQKVGGSIPSHKAYGRQPIDISLSHKCFSLFLPLSLKSITIFFRGMSKEIFRNLENQKNCI